MRIKITNKLIGLLMIFIGISTALRIGVMTFAIEQNTHSISELIQVVNDSPYVANVSGIKFTHLETYSLDFTSILEIVAYLFTAFAGLLLFIGKAHLIPKSLRPLFFKS